MGGTQDIAGQDSALRLATKPHICDATAVLQRIGQEDTTLTCARTDDHRGRHRSRGGWKWTTGGSPT